MIKVSVVIPVYNGEGYIKRCLDSLIEQTLDSVEVIIVNDGSKDNTLSLLQQYQERYPNLFKVFTVVNGGQGIARNFGAKQAKGKYLCFIDSDDYVHPEMLQKLYDSAENNQSDLVICSYYRVNEQGDILYSEMDKVRNIKINMNTSPWNKLFLKEKWDKYEIKFSEGLWYEDLEATLTYLLISENISYLKEPLYYYVQRENSSINKYDQRIENIFEVTGNIYNFAKKNNVLEKNKQELEYYFIMHLVFGHLPRCVMEKDLSKRNEYIKRTKVYLKSIFPQYYQNKYFKIDELKNDSLGMFGIKFVGIRAFRYNLYLLFLMMYDIKLKISADIKRW